MVTVRLVADEDKIAGGVFNKLRQLADEKNGQVVHVVEGGIYNAATRWRLNRPKVSGTTAKRRHLIDRPVRISSSEKKD